MATIGEFIGTFKVLFDDKGLKSAQASLVDTSKKAETTNKGMGRFVVTLSDVGRTARMVKDKIFAMANTVTDFQEEMSKVNTMLDDSTAKFLPEFSDELLDMSVKYGQGTKTLSDGLYDILSASIPAEDALQVLDDSVRAAVGGFTDAGIAADAITTILNSYQLQAEDSADVSDLLFSIVKRGKTTFGELAGSIGTVASTASIAGLSLEELGASLATMTRAGLNTEMATTSLNSILKAFTTPTDQAQEAANKFGLELNTNTLRSEGLVGALSKLKNATEEEIAVIFANQRAFKGLAAIIQQTEGYTYDLDVMLNRAGMTTEAYDKAIKNINVKKKQLAEAFKVLIILIGNEFLPAVTRTIDKMIGVSKQVIEWIRENKQLVKEIGLIVVSVIALGTAILVLMNPIGQIIVGVTTLVALYGYLKSKMDDNTIAGEILRGVFYSIVATVKIMIEQFKALWNGLSAVTAVMRLDFKDAKTYLEKLKDNVVNYGTIFEVTKNKIKGSNAEVIDSIENMGDKVETATDKFNQKTRTESSRTAAKVKANDKSVTNNFSDEMQKRMELKRDANMITMEEYIAFLTAKAELEVADSERWLELQVQINEAKIKMAEEEKQRMQDIFQTTFNLVSQLRGTMQAFSDWKLELIKNETEDALDKAKGEYEQKRQWIEDNIADEDERKNKIEALNEEYAYNQDRIREQGTEKERQQKEKMKAFMIADAIAATALAVVKSLANYGWPLGAIMGALASAQGYAQVAKIRATRFAKGGLVTAPVMGMIGEAGEDEAIVPLESNRTKQLFGNIFKEVGFAGAGMPSVNITINDSYIANRKHINTLAAKIGKVVMNQVKNNNKTLRNG
ncbi:phage tail tape measure protein [Patescibacteria group bacterium]|nr:phage tail tape measure protein [Patescibacteria group bacterium]